MAAIAGNHIILDLSGGNYCMVCAPSTWKPEGEARRQSDARQVLRLLGNSGNSTEPHLHFQVMRGVALRCGGLPYLIDSFELLSGRNPGKRKTLPRQNSASSSGR
jgi:hypothetical protein